MERRKFVQIATAAIATSVAGCAGGTSGPNPEVEDVSTENRVLGDAVFDVLVSNQADAGDILVTVTLYDGSDNELDTSSKKTSIEEDGRTQVTIEMDVPSSTEYYEATAEPV